MAHHPLRLVAILLLLSAGAVTALTPAQWRRQSIYQVLTDRFARSDGSTEACADLNDYCNGTWVGLVSRLDYIQGMGFTAVWISPVVKNPIALTGDGNSYHGYWAQDVYAVNPRFGTAADLRALSDELHRRGMYLMVDVVPNHMGSISSRATVDYGLLRPFNQPGYFHPPCAIDYGNDTSVKQCWLGSDTVSLPDLRTEDAAVANLWNRWIAQLVSNYSIDGLRIDAAYQIDPAFWAGFQAAAGGIHVLGEVWHGDSAVVCPYQEHLTGLMNYPAYYWITAAFGSPNGSIAALVAGLHRMRAACRDVSLLGSFVENHDNPRFASRTRDPSLLRAALAFAVLQDGIPIIYQGQEHAFAGAAVPHNREPLGPSRYDRAAPLYAHIQRLNAIRAWALARQPAAARAAPVLATARDIVMRRGPLVWVTGNRGSGGGPDPDARGGAAAAVVTLTLSARASGFAPGQPLTEVLRCGALAPDPAGVLAVPVVRGRPSVLYPTAALRGSGICGL